jgi:hypothetical protein
MFPAFVPCQNQAKGRFAHDRLWLLMFAPPVMSAIRCDVVSKVLNDQRGSQNRRFLDPAAMTVAERFNFLLWNRGSAAD